MKLFHKLITMNIDDPDNIPGKYRTGRIKVGNSKHGGIYTPPTRAKDLRMLMSIFIDFINSPEIINLTPIIRGAIAHYHLAMIHPFSHGNGKLARFLEFYIIRNNFNKYAPAHVSNFYFRQMDEYYKCFSNIKKSKTRDITPFLRLVLLGTYVALGKTKEAIYRKIRVETQKKYYNNLRSIREITQP